MAQTTFPNFSNMQPTAEDLQLIIDSLRDSDRNRITKDGIFNPGIVGKQSDYLSAGTTPNSLKIKPFIAYTQNGNRIEVNSTWDNLFPTGNVINVTNSNLVNEYINVPVWHTYTQNYTNVYESTTTEQSLTLAKLGKGSILHGIKLRTNTAFASTGGEDNNVYAAIGTSGEPEKFLPFTLISDPDTTADLSVMNLMYSISDENQTDIIISFKSDNYNLNTLSNGALTVNLCIADLGDFDNEDLEYIEGGRVLDTVAGQWEPSTLYYIVARYDETQSDFRTLTYEDSNGNIITTPTFAARLTTNYKFYALRKTGSNTDATTLDDVKLGEVLTDADKNIYAININGKNNYDEPYTQYLTIPGYRWATEIDAAQIADGSVSNAQFQYLNTLRGNVQTQLNTKAGLSTDNIFKGLNTFENQIIGSIEKVNGFTANATPTANSLLVLDENAKIPAAAISESTIVSIGNFYTVSSGVLTNGRSSFLISNEEDGATVVASEENPLVLNYPDGSVEKLTSNVNVGGLAADGYYYLVKEKNGNFVFLPTSGGTKAAIPTITTGTSFSGGTVKNSFDNSATYKAFNGNITTASKMGQVTYTRYDGAETFAGLPNGSSTYIEVNFDTAIVPTGLALCFRANNDQVCTPKSWIFQATNDTGDSKWDNPADLYNSTENNSAGSTWNNNEIKTLPITGNVAYKSFRVIFNVTESTIDNPIYGRETPVSGTEMNVNCYYFQIYTNNNGSSGKIQEGYVKPTTATIGDYFLDISKKPYTGYKATGTNTWTPVNYVKLGFVQLLNYNTDNFTITTYPFCYNTFTVSDGDYSIAKGVPITFNHSLGVIPNIVDYKFICTTANNGYQVGDIISDIYTKDAVGLRSIKNLTSIDVLKVILYPGYTSDDLYVVCNDTSSANYRKLVATSNGYWKVQFYCSRGW